MLFNSFEFALFLPTAFLLYWSVSRKRLLLQNGLLLAASYAFYAAWDWRFLGLMLVSSVTDYLVGIGLQNTENTRKRKLLLGISLTVNLGMLGFFKYFNFFVQEFIDAASHLGFHANFNTLHIILPIGISFYTFQTMAYSIDVYRKHISPEKGLVKYLTFVSFFPQLVAGPIERSRDLLPQFGRVRRFEYKTAVQGLRQVLWGFLAKLLVADNLAPVVEDVFNHYGDKNAATLALGAVLFTVQIYADFSGYSNIAIGTAKLFGIRLSINFKYPLFARDIAEFWRRWHISLSTWCKDYIYIPLGGNQRGKRRQFVNIMITFTLVGLWHGANWTYPVFGAVHGCYFGFLILIGNKKNTGVVAANSLLPSLKEASQMAITFFFSCLALIIFRSASLSDAWLYYESLFGFTGNDTTNNLLFSVGIAAIFLLAEWFQRASSHPLALEKWPLAARWLTYMAILALILTYGEFDERSFIYFQF